MAEEDDQIWVPAKIAVDLLEPIFETRFERQEALIDRLAAGLISTRVILLRMEYKNKENNSSHENQQIHSSFWDKYRSVSVRNIERWDTGDFTCAVSPSHQEYYLIGLFGTTFSKRDILCMLPLAVEANQPHTAIQASAVPSSAPASTSQIPSLKPASATDLERIARIYHGFAGSSGTDDEALRVAVAVFPKHHVARDRFRVIYRGIRGQKNPGRTKG